MKCPKEGCEVRDTTEITRYTYGNEEKVTTLPYSNPTERLHFWQLHFLMNPSHRPKE